MRNIAILIILVVALAAQFAKAQPYGKEVDAAVIFFGSAEVKTVTMLYETPDKYCDPFHEFTIGGKKYASELIDAFRINDETWSSRFDPNPKLAHELKNKLSDRRKNITLALVYSQGAINCYQITHKLATLNVSYLYYQKLNEKPVLVEKYPDFNTVKQWVSDAPEILRELLQADSITMVNKQKLKDYKKEDSLMVVKRKSEPKKTGVMGLIDDAAFEKERKEKREDIGETILDLQRIINNYNVWYNKGNPNKITYYFEEIADEKWTSQYEQEMELQRRIAQRNKEREDKKAATLNAEAAYAKRSTQATPEYASAKDNVPVKKESFLAKLDRIKADGNKVGVQFVLNSVKSPPKTPPNQMAQSGMDNAFGTEYFIEGEYLDEDLKVIGSQFTEELNQALGRNDIELIDLNNIPYRNAKVMGMTTKIDDYWASKYKVVFIFSLNPTLKCTYQESSTKNKYATELQFTSSLMVKEFTGPSNSKDSDIITQMPSFGTFKTQAINQNTAPEGVESMYKGILTQYSINMPEKAKSERQDDLKKLVEKKLK